MDVCFLDVDEKVLALALAVPTGGESVAGGETTKALASEISVTNAMRHEPFDSKYPNLLCFVFLNTILNCMPIVYFF